MDDAVINRALDYAARHQLELAERLGFAIHGTIFVAKYKTKGGKSAVKAHYENAPYRRERDVYGRLREAGIAKLLGFHVLQLVRTDDELCAIEMSIETRPFVLDFAGAFLDQPPDFPQEVWTEWESTKREQFETRWPTVQRILARLEEVGVYMIDVSPSNIAFRD